MSKLELTAPSARGRLAGAAAHPAVVQVGYLRTATTTHQRQLFSKHKDIAYLGKPYPDPATWDLVYRFAGADSALFDLAATRAELETIVSEKVVPGERILTLSDEAILGPYCGDTRVLSQRLLGLFGDPKIVITIRRQDDLLISWLFHTIKKKHARPLASAFREMERYIDNSTSLLHFLDYAPICRSFVDLLGKDNVLILPYELFRSDLTSYAQTLSAFMGIEAEETHRLLSAAVVSNERLEDAGVAYFDFRARYFPSDLKTPRLDVALIRLFGRFGLNADHVGALVARTRAICAERFAQSNRRLADASGLDLQAYRYPGDQDIQSNARALLKPTEIFAIARRLGLPLRVFGYLLLMNLFSIAFELLAIGMLFPILEVMRAGGESAIGTLKGTHWEIMHRVSAFVGVPITLGLLLSVSFGFVILRQLLRYYAARYNHTVERSITNALRLQVFSRFLVADTTVQDQSQVGSIVPFIQVELRRALDVLLSITTSLTLIVQILAYFVALFLLSPLMSFICAGVMALTALLVRGPMGQIKRRGATITSLNKEIVAFMIERLKHARLVCLAQTEKAETRAFNDLSQRLSREGLQQQMAAVRMQLVLEPAVIAVAYLTFFIGGHKFGISVEKLGFFAIVLIRLVPSLRSILTQYSRIVGQLPSLEALDKYMRQIREARETKGGSRAFERLDEGIRYDHLCFTYGLSNVPALSDVSFDIPAHRMTAFVGPSGSGKSTVIDLLPRIRVPSSGTILLDGVPIDEFSTVSVRAGIAFVPQQPQIFNITAAEHIRYGKEDASIDDVREAARLAGALEFIERLPNGFDTLLGDGGKRLSGGQRQRLDIARALVRRAPILILDEPTSALDAEAEARFATRCAACGPEPVSPSS